jgi:cytoskeleton protein RodZ
VLRKADANYQMADMLTLNSGKSVRNDVSAKQERGRGRNAVPTPVQSTGPLLRERREAMGVTLAEAEVATRIRQKYLAALEADEWDLLPGEVVGRGFLRNYSTYLGLEPTEMIDRRRAVADESLAAVLVNTSAGSALPPERKVDYRPKDVALKDEGDELEAPRQINWAPFLTLLALVAFSGLAYLGVTRLGPQMGEMVAAGQRQIDAWQAPAAPAAVESTVATLPPNLMAGTVQDPAATAAVAPDAAPAAPAGTDAVAPVTDPNALAAGTGATGTGAAGTTGATGTDALAGVPAATPAPSDPAAPAGAAVPPAAGDAAPAASAGTISLNDLVAAPAEAAVEAAPAPTAVPTPVPATASVNAGANLRSGPSTDYPILAGLPAGEAITITGRSADGTWFVLSDGSWVFAQLVDNPPAEAPVVEAPPLPAAPVEAAPVEAAPAAP